MQIFNCLVWLEGNGIRTGQVPKVGVSAAEVIVLRKLHGLDAVVDIVRVPDEDRAVEKERTHLERVYGRRKITEMFGDLRMGEDRMPEKLANFKGEIVKPAPAASVSDLDDMAA